MSPGQCSCPECGTILRVRDRSFIGREIECPDCQAKLIIRLTDDRELIAERPVVEKPKKTKPQPNQPAVKSKTPRIAAQILDFVRSPLAVAWGLGIAITAFVGIMMLRPNVRIRPPVKEPPQEVVVAPEPKKPPPTVEESPAEVITPMPTEPQATIEPMADPVVTDAKPAVVEVPPAEKPTTPPTVPEVKPAPAPKPMPVVVKLDIEAMLSQKLKSFETPAQPKSRREILELLEELLGAPIRYDVEELGQKNLDRSISIDLENTTVGGVLKAVLDSAGWEYIVEDSGIRLRPRQVAGADK